MSQVRLLQLANTLDARDGGPARNASDLNKAFNRKDRVRAQLVAITGGRASSLIEAEASSFLEPHPRQFALNGREPDWGPLDLIKAIRQSDALIVHGYYLTWLPVMIVLARLLGTPSYLMPHGALTAHETSTKTAKKKLFNATAGLLIRKLTEAAMTGSAIEKVELQDQFPQWRCHIVGVGVTYTETVVAADRVRTASEPIQLVSFSRIAAKKRIDLIVDCLAKLVERGIDARLSVAGQGPAQMLHDLEGQVDRLGLTHRVRFLGQVDGKEKETLLRTSDVLIAPSDDENFGISVAEAAIRGLPVVVSDKVASATLIAGPGCYIVASPSGERLADAVQSFAANSASEQSSSVSERARRAYDWSLVSNRWLRAMGVDGH